MNVENIQQPTFNIEHSTDGAGDRLDQDQLSQLFADCEAGVADLTDEVVLAGNQADDLVFADADFSQPILNFGCGAELLHANRHSCLNTA